MNTSTTASGMKPGDKWIPWYFVAFFVVVAIVNAIFVTEAISTFRGVVTEHPYQEGLAYNQVVADVTAQEALGWKGVIKQDGDTLSFTFHDKKGMAITQAKVKADFVRTTQVGYDFSVPLHAKEGGVYQAKVHFPLKGQWHVRIIAQWNQQPYQQTKLIMVK